MPDTLPAAYSVSYLDFDLEIALGQGRKYPLAARSQAGEARATMIFPFDDLALENRLKDLQIALLHSSGKHRQALTHEQQAVQDFGRALFDALLSGDVRRRYEVCQEKADQQGKGLRVRLRIQAPELAALPWEFIYDPRQREYVCLSANTPVVRYPESPRPVQPLSVAPPLRILGLVADPENLDRLDVQSEKERLERALRDLQRRGLAELHWLGEATRYDLQRTLRNKGPWHIFHFVGHGGFDVTADEGVIVFEDEHKQAHTLYASQLARLLADHRPLRLAVLNACGGAQGSRRDLFSSSAAILVQRGLPAVLAMQYAITDRAAIGFSQAFYESLVDGLPVDAAVAEARKAVSLAVNNSLEWGTPVLYMRSPDGMLFDVKGQVIGNKGTGDSEQRAAVKEREAWGGEARQSAPESQVSSAPDVPKPVAKPQTSATGSSETRPVPQILVPKAQIVTPTPSEFALTLAPGVDLSLRYVEAGEFLMGSDKKIDPYASDDELHQHKLYLENYFVGEYLVTNEQYQVFVQATGRPAPEHWKNGKIPNNKEQHPVVYVDWQDALAFCQWASQVTAKPVCLPSEAEWEKAASWQPSPPSLPGKGAGGVGQKRIYPWGDAFDKSKCNISESGIGDTTPVGKYSPQGDSPYGCADMAGNVWEWTRSLLESYPYPNDPQARRKREDLQVNGNRVVRGGSWYLNEWYVRCAFRDWSAPSRYASDLGFRVVCSLAGSGF